VQWCDHGRFGPPELKLAQYDEYVHNQRVERAGIKLFYHHDSPLLTPRQSSIWTRFQTW